MIESMKVPEAEPITWPSPRGLALVDKKMREAAFFAGGMRQRDPLSRLDDEVLEIFDFYLSAFLNASYSACEKLRAVYGRNRLQPNGDLLGYSQWYEGWEETLSSSDRSILAFMREDRNREIHRKTSNRERGTSNIALSSGETYRDQFGTLTAYGEVPGPAGWITVVEFQFTVDGADRKVTDVCDRYIDLLRHVVQHARKLPGID